MSPDALRRSGRIPRQLAISLIGSDMEGKVFSEETTTVLLSRHGAGIVSTYKLSSEQELIVRCIDSNKEAEVRVVGQIGSQGDTYIYGVAFLKPDINFWGIDFPAVSESEARTSRMLLECSNCGLRETPHQSDMESDVYAVNESIVRYCKKCGSSTMWKKPLTAPRDGLDAKTPAIAQDVSPALPLQRPDPAPPLPPPQAGLAPPTSKELENRRKYVRTKVNFKACIRRSGVPDEIVTCEDMSRGGLRFRSRKQYFEKMVIEVAVPYSPDGQSIFVPAQVVYVQELPEQKLFRCGVAYLRPPGRPRS